MTGKLSLRWFLVIGCLLLIWGITAITTTSSYLSSQSVLLEHSKSIMRNIVDFATVQAQHYLNIANHSTRLTRRLLNSDVLGLEENRLKQLELYYLELLETHQHFAGIYYADTNGGFFYVSRMGEKAPGRFRTKHISILDNQRKVTLSWRDAKHQLVETKTDDSDRYDPRSRPWYLKAVSAGEAICTNPYIFYTSNKPGITIAEPVFNPDGSVAGVVGADIEIDQLSQFIGQLKIGQNGSAYMISDNAKLAAYPQMSKIMRDEEGRSQLVSIREIDEPLSRKAFSAIDWSEDDGGSLVLESATFARFEEQGKTYHTMFSPFPLKQWPLFIGVYLPEDDYLGVIKENRMSNILFALLVSVIATVIALRLTSSINRPLANLAREAKSIENQDFLTPFDTNSAYDEIQHTADAFSHMKAALTSVAQEREQAFGRLRDSETRYRDLVENAVEGIFQGIPMERFISVNPSLAAMCGYDSSAEMCERGWQETDLFVDLDVRERFLGRLMNGEIIRGFELQVKRKDRSTFWAAVSARAVRDENNTFRYIEGSVWDISERKALEESKREQLSANAANQAKSEFLANMSHEIRTPLNVIKGFAELALSDGDMEKGREHLTKISTASANLLGIVNDILDFSKIEAERLTLEEAPFQIPRLFEKLDDLFSERAKATGVDFTYEIGGEVKPTQVGDSLRLEQVLINLIDNAFKFTEQGGITVRVSCVRTRLGRNRLRFVVEDTGIGISGQDLQSLFDPFTQEDSSISRRYGGTGLGLAICKRLVEMMNGTLVAENRVEGGSRFSFEASLGVDTKLSAATPDSYTHKPATYDFSTCHILIAEDNELTQELMRELLEKVGAKVTIVDNGEEAVDFVRESAPDLVIMDLQMPVIDGFQATKTIRFERDGNWLPIVALSAHAVTGYRERCIQAGMDDYLTKPIAASELYATVAKWLITPVGAASHVAADKSGKLLPDKLPE